MDLDLGTLCLPGALLAQVPLQIPPGMPAAQAQAMIEYLKSNPQAAKAAYEQAQALLKNPAMAQAFMNMNVSCSLTVSDTSSCNSPARIMQGICIACRQTGSAA